MATAIGDLVARLRMDTSGFKRSSRGAAGTLQSLSRVAGSFGVAMGAAGVAGAFAMAGRAANDFQGEMNRSLAIMTDVSEKMRKEMELTAHTIAASTQFSANEAAQAYFFLASAGMDAKASMMALGAVAEFAQAGNFSLALATDLATDAQSALGLKSADAADNLKNLTRVTDVLVKANTVANASVQQFSESITNKAGVAARMYGISLEETTAVLAAFADQGIKGADAGTKFGIVLRDLTTKAITNKAEFKALGLAVFDARGEVRPFADIIGGLESVLEGLSDEMQKTALLTAGFTDKSVSGLQALLGYSDAIRKWEEDMKMAGGTVKDVSDNVLTDFDEAWNKVTASMSKASTEGFTPILEQLATMIDRLDTTNKQLDKTESNWTKAGKSIAWYAQAFSDLAKLSDAPASLIRDQLSSAYEAIKAGFTGGTWTPTTLEEKLRNALPAGMIPERTLSGATSQEELTREAQERSAAKIFGFDRPPVSAEAKATQADNEQRAKDSKAFMDAIPNQFDLGTTAVGGMPMWMTQMLQGVQMGLGSDMPLGADVPLDTPASRGPRLSAAQEKGSAAAYSTIVQAGKGGEKTAKETLKTTKQLLAVNRKILQKQDPQLVSIPVG